MNRPEPKSWINAIHAYVPGKSKSADGKPLVKLSANENPLGTSPAAIAAMGKGVADGAALYPDPDSTELRTAIATVHNVAPENIVCGTGSGELVYLAAQGYAGPGDEIIYVRYGFSLYDIAARRVGAIPVAADDVDYATSVEAILACLTDKTRLVFVANPNNPTGTLSSRAEIMRLHAALPSDVLLVLDQAYAEYLDDDQDDGGLELARTAKNVLVTRTFSKIYGLAAERLGWATASPEIIATLNKIRGPFNTTLAGQAAAIAALADQDFVQQSREHNRKLRAWLCEQLGTLGNHGVRVVPGYGNFLLVLFEGAVSAETAYNGLIDAGYIVRWLPGQGLPHALRITIGTQADMQAIADRLRHIVEAHT